LGFLDRQMRVFPQRDMRTHTVTLGVAVGFYKINHGPIVVDDVFDVAFGQVSQ
jgi:hypothetical protein